MSQLSPGASTWLAEGLRRAAGSHTQTCPPEKADSALIVLDALEAPFQQEQISREGGEVGLGPSFCDSWEGRTPTLNSQEHLFYLSH